MKIFSQVFEILGAIAIALSPTLIGFLIGGFVYLAIPNGIGLSIFILLCTLGLVAGCFWAAKIWRTRGTISFLSQISATPELDIKQENKRSEEKP